MSRNCGQSITALGLVLLGALACRTKPGRAESATSLREGIFDYWANAQRHELRGIVRMTADTVVLEARDGRCRPAVAPPNRQFVLYECAGPSELGQLELRIDRQNPQLASTWRATFKVQRQRVVCAKDAVTVDGQRLCMKSETENYEESMTLTGPLRLRPRRG